MGIWYTNGVPKHVAGTTNEYMRVMVALGIFIVIILVVVRQYGPLKPTFEGNIFCFS